MSEMILDGAGNPANTGQAAAGDLIKDSSTAQFMADVVEASREQLILVDFWAPWCGPCKQLTPILEKVVKAAAGAVKLVKIDVDQNQAVAQQLGVQSIPAVFGFKNGQPVDAFMGAKTESEVKAFIEKHAGPIGPSPVDAALEAAQTALDADDIQIAAQGFTAVLQHEAQNSEAIGGLTRCYLAAGEIDKARQTLELAGPDTINSAPIAGAQAALELAEQGLDAGDLTGLQEKVETNPADHQTRFDFAIALNAAGQREEAVDQLVELIRRDKKWNEEAARKQLLQFFEAWGPADEASGQGRRKLSAVLFA